MAASRASYSWPPGCTLDESLWVRDHLEACIRRDIDATGALSLGTFRKVIYWGFGQASKATEMQVRDQSADAYAALTEGRLADAVAAFLEIDGVGISRAAKLVALADQNRLGIYDSVAAARLNVLAGEPVVLVPAGRPGGRAEQLLELAHGSATKGTVALAQEYPLYIEILQGIRDRAVADPDLAMAFPRVRDVEIALFAWP